MTDTLSLIFSVTPTRNCRVQVLLRCRGTLCLALTLLWLSPSLARAQQRPAHHSPSTFRGNLTPWRNASRNAPALSPSLAPKRDSRSGLRKLLESSAVEAIASLARLGDVESYREHPAAGLKLKHTTAGMKFRLPVMPQSRLSFRAEFGVGQTRLRSYELGEIPIRDYRYRLSETFFSLLGGLTLQYNLNDHSRAFVGVRQYLYLNDADDASVQGVRNPGELLEGSSWTFPLAVGFQLNFK